MSFTPPPSLPPMSTLSAVLDGSTNGSMVIAPELMGEEGLPPSIKRAGSESGQGPEPVPAPAGNQGSSGYQSSSARDERTAADGEAANAGWNGGSGYANNRHHHPWEEQDPEYRDHPSASLQHGTNDYSSGSHNKDDGADDGDMDQGDKPKPKKRARVSKPRQSKDRNGVKDDGIPEEGVFDYADPSGDYHLGPIFVLPPPSAAQACVRCHKIKRKCDNARPRCAGCSKADVACVFELSPATASYVTGLKSDNIALTSQIASAAERIQQLESAISNIERGLPPTSDDQDLYGARLAGRSDLTGQASPRTEYASLSRAILSVRSTDSSLPMSVFGEQQNPAALPPYETASQAVDLFFLSNAISYPFLNKDEFLRDMDEIYRRDRDHLRRPISDGASDDALLSAGKEFLFFMVIAIGTTNQERLGEAEKGSSRAYKARAMQSLHAAVAKEDLLAVQSLIVLGIYLLYDPSGIPLWHVVGFAARIATALNLHRRAKDADLPRELLEHRRRVFYSLFNLDRLVAVTLSKPLAIADNDIDVEPPSSLPTDELFRGRPRIEFTQHIIKLRRLSGAILTTVYSISGEQNTLPEPERASIILDLHSRLDSWLAQCPLSPDTENDKRSMVTDHSWFLLSYHQALCLLYRPSPLYAVMTPERLSALHEASTRCVDLYIELWHEQKIGYNLVNVSTQFLACISLLYCLCEYDRRDPELVNNDNWRAEVGQRVGQCHELLEAFSRALPETAKYREVFRTLSDLLMEKYGPLPPTGNSTLTPSASRASNALTTIPPAISTGQNGSEAGKPESGEGETAWNAMSQLWHNSGEFAFDERAMSGVHPFIQGIQAMGEQSTGQANGTRGIDGLWSQLG
ncbi:hypothetical protein IAU60_002920 [Kwoniella sp. DSM 27419]